MVGLVESCVVRCQACVHRASTALVVCLYFPFRTCVAPTGPATWILRSSCSPSVQNPWCVVSETGAKALVKRLAPSGAGIHCLNSNRGTKALSQLLWAQIFKPHSAKAPCKRL